MLDCMYDREYKRGDIALIKVMKGDHSGEPWFSTSLGPGQMFIIDPEQRWANFPFAKRDLVVVRIQTTSPLKGDPVRIITPTRRTTELYQANRRTHSNWLTALTKRGALRNVMEEEDVIMVVLSDTEALAVEPQGTGWLVDLVSHTWFLSLTAVEVGSYLTSVPFSMNKEVLYWTTDFTFTEDGEWGRVVRFFSHLREREYLAAANVLGDGEIPTKVEFEPPSEFWAWFPRRVAVTGTYRASKIGPFNQTGWWNWVWIHVLNNGEPKTDRRSQQQR